jgi:hypothetical protein
LIIRKKKTIKIDVIHLKAYLSTFVSNMLLTLRIMNFENVFLQIIIHFMLIKTWMHNINNIDQDVIKR